MTSLRLAFMGTPDFSVPALAELIAAGHEIVRVYTQPPRPSGRGKKERPSPVHEFAETNGLAVETPRTMKQPETQKAFLDLDLDAAVIVAYGLILPKPVLEAPRLGCLNLHASLLPRWRGAAPIQRAIMAGDDETGVTIMMMDEGLDTGPMLMTERVRIGPDTTSGELHDTLSRLGATLMTRALGALDRGAIQPVPQPADGVTYAPKIEKSEAKIDWARPAVEIERMVRAMNPSPGAYFEAGNEDRTVRLKVLRATVVQNRQANGSPGTVLDDKLTIACGDAALRLLVLQRAGRAPTEAAAFQRGFRLSPGTRLV